jgi:hypothetical protein
MTTPNLYKGKKSKTLFRGKTDGLQWVPAAAFLGGVFLSMVAALTHRKDLAVGLGWGSLLNVFNFYSLKILTEKVLSRSETEGRKFFWLWNAVRWIFLAAACGLFLSVSPLCLAGAGASYFWFLSVLGFAGWRSASMASRK